MSTTARSDHATPEQVRAFMERMPEVASYCKPVAMGGRGLERTGRFAKRDLPDALAVIRTLEAALRDVVEATDKESKWRDRLTREPTHRNLREWEAWTKLLQDRIAHAAALLGTKDTGVK